MFFEVVGVFSGKAIDSKIFRLALAIFLMVVNWLQLMLKNHDLKPTLSILIGGRVFSVLTAGLRGTIRPLEEW